jgi:hypothetical protein
MIRKLSFRQVWKTALFLFIGLFVCRIAFAVLGIPHLLLWYAITLYFSYISIGVITIIFCMDLIKERLFYIVAGIALVFWIILSALSLGVSTFDEIIMVCATHTVIFIASIIMIMLVNGTD